MRANSSEPASNGQQIVTIDLLRPDDSLAKFSKLMPDLMHARWINCHGLTNLATGNNHFTTLTPEELAQIPKNPISRDQDKNAANFNQVCLPCHDDGAVKQDGKWIAKADPAKSWRLAPNGLAFVKPAPLGLEPAPKGVSFVNKTPFEICQMWQVTIGTPEKLKEHFRMDPLANNAFVGTRGEQNETPDPPPIHKKEFDGLVEDWLKGHQKIPCDSWVGRITQTETVELKTTYATSTGNIDTTKTEVQVATRTVTITIDDGVSVTITVEGKDTVDDIIVTGEGAERCRLTAERVTAYGTQGTPISGRAQSAKVLVPPGGKYYVSIQGPEEHTKSVEDSTVDFCVLGRIPASAPRSLSRGTVGSSRSTVSSPTRPT
jgi:hypothetical protein